MNWKARDIPTCPWKVKVLSIVAVCVFLVGLQGVMWFRARSVHKNQSVVINDSCSTPASEKFRWDHAQLFKLESWAGHGIQRTKDGEFLLHDATERSQLHQTVSLGQLEPKGIRISFQAQMIEKAANLTLYVDFSLVTKDDIYGRSKLFKVETSTWESFHFDMVFPGRIIDQAKVSFFCPKEARIMIRNSRFVQESEEWVHGFAPVQQEIEIARDFKPTMHCKHGSNVSDGPLATAIMLHWKRTANVIAQVSALLQYSFIGEVIIWNNNPHTLLRRSQFSGSATGDRVRIINSPANMHDYAKYLACSQARNEYCYFQDEDWENCHLNELYSSFVMAPNLIHLVSMPDLVWEHHYWSATNVKVGLKANFAWLGTGSFIPQRMTQTFLRQLSYFDLEGYSLMTIDAWFVLWTNRAPCRLQVELQSLAPPKDDAWSAGRDHFAILYGHMNRALGILMQGLESENPLFQKSDEKEEQPENVRWLKAICKGKDFPCLFKSSLSYMVPQLSFPPWNSSILIQKQVVSGKNSYSFAHNHHFLAAVDGSPDTCLILPASSEPFFVGLDLLEQKSISEVMLHSPYEGKVAIRFSNTGGDVWFHAGNLEKRSKLVHGLKFSSENHLFRHVNLHFGPTSESTSICELTVSVDLASVHLKRTEVQLSRNLPLNLYAPGITSETGASAVLILWKRNSTLASIVRHITSHRWVKELIIWNNNPERIIRHPFIASLLHPQSHARVKVVNSPHNMLFLARFLACQMASEPACYFQDDDWMIKSMNSLFHQWKRCPDLLHTLTNPLVHYLSWAWTFCWRTPHAEIVTGFSWLGTGAIASRKVVSNFLQQMATVADSPDIWNHADMYFSTWMNSVPYQLSSDLTELTSEFSYTYSDKGGIDRNKRHIRDGARQMHANVDAFVNVPLRPPWSERWVRSPCISDTCLFFTSAHAFLDPSLVTYDPSFSLDEIQDRHLEAFGSSRYNQWLQHPYHHAVDANAETYYSFPEGSHVFGLLLITSSTVNGIEIKVDNTSNLKRFHLEVLTTAEGWGPVDFGKNHKGEGTVSIFFVHTMIEGARFICSKERCGALKIYNMEFF